MDTVASRLKFARQKKGWSQTRLAKEVGITYQSVQAVEEGGGSKYLSAMARALSVNLDWLERGEGPMEAPEPAPPPKGEGKDSTSNEVELIGPTPARDYRDTIPVRAARGGSSDVEMFVDDNPIDYRPRPPVLDGVQGAYSMWVSGTSMLPLVKPGHILHVNPQARALPGDLVIVWKRNNAVIVKEYVRRTAEELVVAEYNGQVEPKHLTFKHKDVLAVHKVVGADFA